MKAEDIPRFAPAGLESTSCKNILVVDDEELAGSLIVRLLKMEGYEATWRKDGQSALEFLGENCADMLITDLRMPGMGGLELIKTCRGKDMKQMDIMVITGYGNMDIFIEAMRAGASDFIVKPIEKDQFIRSVKRVMDKRTLKDDLAARTKQLLQAEKMATVGILSAGIAHEINNPNTFIRTNLQLMLEYIKRLRPKMENLNDEENAEMTRNIILNEFPEMLNEALKGTERIHKIVSGIKHYSHEGDDSFNEDVDIRKVIAHAVNMVRSKLRKYVTITESYLNIREIKGQFSKLEQVFVNLLVNGADAIEEKAKKRIKAGDRDFMGLIDVSATVIEGDIVEEEATPDYLVLTFYDNGSGIPKGKMNKVFDPFFTTKPVGVGTGLGLYICYDIIRRHGGDITVQSEEGEGTAFIIKLPVKGIAATRPADADSEDTPSPRKIL